MSEDRKTIQKKEAEKQGVAERTRSTKVFTPPVDIFEREDDLFLIADMPGVNAKSIDITIDKGVLTIKGEIKTEDQMADYNLVYAEYEVGDYQRSFNLSDSIDQSKIEANYENGVLKVKLPKGEKAKPKRIEVKF